LRLGSHDSFLRVASAIGRLIDSSVACYLPDAAALLGLPWNASRG
jgi:hypothetical protein